LEVEKKKKKKHDEKAKEKIETGKGKKTKVRDEITSTVLDKVSQPKPASNKGTKWDSSHLFVAEERLTLGLVVVDLGDGADVHVDELIINSSFALLIPEVGPKP
jgi:hypothetical protein